MRRPALLFPIILIATLALPPAAPGASDAVQRFSMVVGANYGGPTRPSLRYAVSDARTVLKTLNEMGGVDMVNASLLVEPGRTQFLSSLDELRAKIMRAAEASRRVEFVFYYSGHSDEEGILLGREKVSYRDIRRSIEGMPADVRIAILDSCSSGAFTQMKGGKARSPFMVDSSYSMKGYAFLTSSSADEASQESERLCGSFFTNALVAGLRGAADLNDDRRVTLNEAYQFAYHETLARTERTYGGPQHPNYHIRMTGTGDVVITDIRGRSSLMAIAPGVKGRLSIRDRKGALVAELTKHPGRGLTLALDEGKYMVLKEDDGKLFEAGVTLRKNSRAAVHESMFAESGREYAVARGGKHEGVSDDSEYRVVPYSFSLVPVKKGNEGTIHRFSLGLFGSYCSHLRGFDAGLGVAIVEENVRGVQIYGLCNYVMGDVRGVQAAYVLNYAAGDARGVQLSSVVNWVKGDSTYTQISTGFKYAGGNMSGFQATGIVNIARGDVSGCQFAAVANTTGGRLDGAQISIVNVAGKSRGAQFGVVNVSDDFKGLQAGIVNVAKEVRGAQFGVVNVAGEMKGVPIGLVNLSKNGGLGPVAWWSSLTAANAGVRFRSGRIYSIIAAGGVNREADDGIKKSVAAQFFYGFRIPLERWFVDCDAGFSHLDNEPLYSESASNDQMAIQGRVSAGISFAGGLSVFAGGGTVYLWDYGKIGEGGYRPLFLAGAAVEF